MIRKFERFGNVPIVERWYLCKDIENSAIENALTEQNETDLHYVGRTKVKLVVAGTAKWYNLTIRVVED